jgi:site-specific recombinase XerD
MHELRHSAADNLWRATGDLMLAQQLLRHESVATTQAYLHPTRDDLADALAALPQLVRSENEETA